MRKGTHCLDHVLLLRHAAGVDVPLDQTDLDFLARGNSESDVDGGIDGLAEVFFAVGADEARKSRPFV